MASMSNKATIPNGIKRAITAGIETSSVAGVDDSRHITAVRIEY